MRKQAGQSSHLSRARLAVFGVAVPTEAVSSRQLRSPRRASFHRQDEPPLGRLCGFGCVWANKRLGLEEQEGRGRRLSGSSGRFGRTGRRES